jgi:hypothetical protein
MSPVGTETIVRRLIQQAHRDRYRLAVIRKAGPSIRGHVTDIAADGFHLRTAQGPTWVWWGDVWSVFRVRPAA